MSFVDAKESCLRVGVRSGTSHILATFPRVVSMFSHPATNLRVTPPSVIETVTSFRSQITIVYYIGAETPRLTLIIATT